MLNSKIINLLNDYVKPVSSGCWEWQRALNAKGYGQLRFESKNYLVHRLSWQLFNGEIPKGLLVCHSCDNPKCCNPDHLFLGTSQDNSNDMVMKGRSNKGKHYPKRAKKKLKASECFYLNGGIVPKSIINHMLWLIAYNIPAAHIARLIKRDPSAISRWNKP